MPLQYKSICTGGRLHDDFGSRPSLKSSGIRPARYATIIAMPGAFFGLRVAPTVHGWRTAIGYSLQCLRPTDLAITDVPHAAGRIIVGAVPYLVGTSVIDDRRMIKMVVPFVAMSWTQKRVSISVPRCTISRLREIDRLLAAASGDDNHYVLGVQTVVSDRAMPWIADLSRIPRYCLAGYVR